MEKIFDKWNVSNNEIINSFQEYIFDSIEEAQKIEHPVLRTQKDCIFLDPKDTSKRQYIETTYLEREPMQDCIDNLGVTISHSVNGLNNINLETWLLVPPHVDTDEDTDDATGYNENRYFAFLFLKTDKHVIQTGFPERMNYWSKDNIPQHSEELKEGDIVILDVHHSHALAFSDNKHLCDLNMPREDFIKNVMSIIERRAIALSLPFDHFPSREEVIQQMEDKIINSYPYQMKM